MKLKVSADVQALNPGIGAAVEVEEKKGKVPRGPAEERTGLRTFIDAGWHYTFSPLHGDRLEKEGMDTGWCESERACVIAARLLIHAGRAVRRVGETNQKQEG